MIHGFVHVSSLLSWTQLLPEHFRLLLSLNSWSRHHHFISSSFSHLWPDFRTFSPPLKFCQLYPISTSSTGNAPQWVSSSNLNWYPLTSNWRLFVLQFYSKGLYKLQVVPQYNSLRSVSELLIPPTSHLLLFHLSVLSWDLDFTCFYPSAATTNSKHSSSTTLPFPIYAWSSSDIPFSSCPKYELSMLSHFPITLRLYLAFAFYFGHFANSSI